MGLYQHLASLWRKPKELASWKENLVKWRREPVTVRIEHPTRLDRARTLGYKAKQGVFLVRQRVNRGGHTRSRRLKGKRSKNQTIRLTLHKNYRQIAEERASKAFSNAEVLNSYEVGKDGKHLWYEVIMVDRTHPAVLKHVQLKGIASQQGRAHRGLTQAGRRVRGLLNKGKGAEKARPSRRANDRRL